MSEKNLSHYFASTAAAFFVAFYDLGFNENQSLIMKTGEIIRKHFFKSWDYQAWPGLIFVLIATLVMTFIESPKSKGAAAKLGFGILGFLTTLASPIKVETISTQTVASWMHRSIASEKSAKILVQVEDDGENDFQIQLRDAKTDEIVITEEKRTGNTIEFYKLDRDTEYLVYVEAKDARWTRLTAKPNTSIKIKPEDSKIPMFLQRFLGTSKPSVVKETTIQNQLKG